MSVHVDLPLAAFLLANPAGLWALLGLPAILAIHFLQQKARTFTTSTWFLIEHLAPDSSRGRTWEKLRTSRALWLQLLAVLASVWLLTEPRWVLAGSAQTVVVVLDASASMSAFRTAGVAAAEHEMEEAEGLADRTTWVILTSDPRQPPLYRGEERRAAVAALSRWDPLLGSHDLGPQLRLASALAGTSGRTLLVTDGRGKVPPGQRAVGVGKALPNVGFAGAATEAADETGSSLRWRAVVRNHATVAQRRTWHYETIGATQAANSPVATLDLAPGALAEIGGEFPTGTDRIVVVLEGDGFALDDRLPLQRPAAKPLPLRVEGNDAVAEYFRRVTAGVAGVTTPSGDGRTPLRLSRLSDADGATVPGPGIYWAISDPNAATARMATAPVIPAREPLVAALNWQGWLGLGPFGFTPKAGDTSLLWQDNQPLAFLRGTGSGRRQLFLAFDWDRSNAARLPATVLLLRRFLEAERDAQRAPWAANFDADGPLKLAGVSSEEALTLEYRPTAGDPLVPRPLAIEERRAPRTPGRPGFFTLKAGEEIIVTGAAQFADSRQGDFTDAATFTIELPGARQAAIERNTRDDPLAPFCLLLMLAALLGSWWETVGRRRTVAPKGVAA
jgi:hypothetical protein